MLKIVKNFYDRKNTRDLVKGLTLKRLLQEIKSQKSTNIYIVDYFKSELAIKVPHFPFDQIERAFSQILKSTMSNSKPSLKWY